MDDREMDRRGQTNGFLKPRVGRARWFGHASVAFPWPLPRKDNRGAGWSRAVGPTLTVFQLANPSANWRAQSPPA